MSDIEHPAGPNRPTDAEDVHEDTSEKKIKRASPIIALGASAGGLESLEDFFENVPLNTGLTFVVLQHLSPDFKSVMDELLGRRTDIPIQQAADGLRLEKDCVYLIPPKQEAILTDGCFRLRDKEPREALSLPIDHFFRSLAQEAGEDCVAVVLSGSGSDGSRGVRDVSAAGGLVIACPVHPSRLASWIWCLSQEKCLRRSSSTPSVCQLIADATWRCPKGNRQRVTR